MHNSMVMSSYLGNIELMADDEQLVSLQFTEKKETLHSSKFLQEVKVQLEAYLKGELQAFDIPLLYSGSEFQQEVWQGIQSVPYGKTASYHDIALQVGRPHAVRAVGAANGANPILIITPCHRVISKSGQLTGYAGGLWRKVKLLQLEAKDQPGNQYSLGF